MLSLSSINSNDIAELIRDTNGIIYSLLSLSLLSNEILILYNDSCSVISVGLSIRAKTAMMAIDINVMSLYRVNTAILLLSSFVWFANLLFSCRFLSAVKLGAILQIYQ